MFTEVYMHELRWKDEEELTWLATRILGELTHIKRCYCLRIHVADKCLHRRKRKRPHERATFDTVQIRRLLTRKTALVERMSKTYLVASFQLLQNHLILSIIVIMLKYVYY